MIRARDPRFWVVSVPAMDRNAVLVADKDLEVPFDAVGEGTAQPVLEELVPFFLETCKLWWLFHSL